MSKISQKRHFCRKKTPEATHENLKQGLGAAARPAAAAARHPKAAAGPEKAAGRPEKAAGRPEPARRPGGRREAKIRVFPKMPGEPLGGSGGSP